MKVLVFVTRTVRADGFVGDVAGAAFDAIVDGDLANGAESFVVEGRHAECRAQLFVELAQVGEVRGEGGDLQAIVGEQKFLITSVPQTGELAFEHDGGNDRHLVGAVGVFANLRAAAVFFDAHNAAGAAHAEAQCGETLNGLLRKTFVDVPHGYSDYGKGSRNVKDGCSGCGFASTLAQDLEQDESGSYGDIQRFHRPDGGKRD